MKVAYFTESLPPNTDGVVNTLSHLVDTLNEENIDFRFYSPVKPSNDVVWNDRVTKVASLSLKPYFHYRVGLPNSYRINEELDRFSPDLIHVVTPSLLGLQGMNYAKSRDLRLVTSYHTHFVRYFEYYSMLNLFSPVTWQYLEWFHNQCDCTYAPSSETVHELTDRGIRNVQLWQRGIDLHRFSPAYRNNSLRKAIGAADKPVLLFVGRLVKEKDLGDLVEANHILNSQGLDFKQVFVGDGPMREELQNRLPDAFFAGYQYKDKLAEWYASSDLFVFPSTTETFGNVILEAFASGIPAIGVNKGGQADLIEQEKSGYITEANNPVKFAERIAELLKYPEKRQRFASYAEQAVRRFSWRTINLGLLDSYKSILNLN